MRNGPLVYRRAYASRFACGAPSPLERLHSLSAFGGGPRPVSRRGRAHPAAGPVQFESQRLELGSRLSINLRRFLTQQLGATMRIEDDSIVALEPRSSDALMRELARAIRRFSAERAREAWCECAIGMERLEREFFGAPAAECAPAVLCLRCACVEAGQYDCHCGARCVRLDLAAEVRMGRLAGESQGSGQGSVVDAIHRAIERFRGARDAAHLPHYDLDYYTAAGQVVFTWRPIPD
ncbi:MAG: hypothetical protein ACREQI_11225 [Candidatus Binataceae bacterium]